MTDTETELTRKVCEPCRGGIPPLPVEEVAKYMARVPGWETAGNGTMIEADFKFRNFRQALDFVREVGELAEAEFHHPVSVTFGWGFAHISLQSKKIKGLHENDFILAAKINEIAGRLAAEAVK